MSTDPSASVPPSDAEASESPRGDSAPESPPAEQDTQPESPDQAGQTATAGAPPPRRPQIRVGSRPTGGGPLAPVLPPVSTKIVPVDPVPPVSGEAKPDTESPQAEKAPATDEKHDKDSFRDERHAPVTVPPPSRRDPLTADMEQELEAMLAGTNMEDLVAANQSAILSEPLEVDSRTRGSIVKIHGDNVFFTLDGRNEGFASLRQFREQPEVGQAMDVVITRYHADDGLYEVLISGATVSVQDWSDLREGTVVQARITGSNSGGLECLVGQIRGFIPASQVEIFHVDDLADYHEKTLPCVVTEANQRKRNLVLSHRDVLEREREEKRQKLLEQMEVGDVMEGIVSNIRDFGAFVDLGGLDGLIHISQLSWDRVEDPHDILEQGQKVRVRVEKIDKQTGKIGLSYRNLLEQPWATAEERFPVGAVIKGTVTRTASFGAFIKVAFGIEGLVHISELAHHRVVQVANVVKEGAEVDVKVLGVDAENQRMSLSMKEAQQLPEKESKEGSGEEPEEPLRELAVPPRNEPLKGGTGRDTGGESFGLKW